MTCLNVSSLVFISSSVIFFYVQEPVFENCSCVAENLYLVSQLQGSNTSDPSIAPLEYVYGNSTAADGMCSVNCHNLGPFLFFCGMLIFLLFVLKIPNVLVTIRYVSSNCIFSYPACILQLLLVFGLVMIVGFSCTISQFFKYSKWVWTS